MIKKKGLIILKVTKDYLNHSRLEEGTDRQYGEWKV